MRFCPTKFPNLLRLLKALGAPSDTRIYWAGGQPLGGKEALQPLTREFPNFYNKEDLSLPSELEPFAKKASFMAAIDYIVCESSEVFMPSHGGNMGHAIQVYILLLFVNAANSSRSPLSCKNFCFDESNHKIITSRLFVFLTGTQGLCWPQEVHYTQQKAHASPFRGLFTPRGRVYQAHQRAASRLPGTARASNQQSRTRRH